MSRTVSVHARQTLDSKGNPTVEVDVLTENGLLGRTAVPSGASTGEYEAAELHDGDKDYMGKGVSKAVTNVNEIIAEEIVGIGVFEQNLIDQAMIALDGTPNKSKLGANVTLGVSLAVIKAAAEGPGLPLYRYVGGVSARTLLVFVVNIINIGAHSGAPIAFQEFMIMPVNAKDFSQAIQMGAEVFHNLKKVLHDKSLGTAVGDEGSFAPAFKDIEDALDSTKEAINKADYEWGEDIKIALDCASSEFYKDGKYDCTIFEGAKDKVRTSAEQAEYLAELVAKYPIISIEDGMDQNNWDGWKLLTEKIGGRIQLVGDDSSVTNVSILERGIAKGIANSIPIKVNQIGTLSETTTAVEMINRAGYTAVMPHHSGEIGDSTIADLAVALNTKQIKTGSASRSDRMVKYNQLLRIEEQLGSVAYYPKEKAFNVKD